MANNSIGAVAGSNITSMQEMLKTMRATALEAGASADSVGGIVPNNDFASILKTSLEKVSATQQSADVMAQKLVSGDTTQNLHEVMIALQTASVSFQQMVQVRNKMVSAYQEIMNMQV